MKGISCLNDVLEFEKTPLQDRGLAPNTFEAVLRTVQSEPDKMALRYVFQGGEPTTSIDFTYAQLGTNITRAANLFTSLGVGKHDVVSFVLPNLPQTCWTLLGAQRVGVVNPINPLLEPEAMADIMRAAGTKVLVTIGPFVKTDIWQKVVSICDKIPTLECVLRISMAQFLPGWKKLVGKGLAWKAGLGISAPEVKVLDFDSELVLQPSGGIVSDWKPGPGDIASLFHTGGTTGTPKLARHSHLNEVYDAWVVTEIANLHGKTLFCGLPFFHVNAVVLTALAPWSAGGTTILASPAGYRGEGVLDNFWKMVEHYKVQFFSGVPTVYSALLNRPVDGADIGSLEACICGAAPMPVEVFRQFEERTGLKILEGYGLTEATCASSANPLLGERRIGSVGLRFPYEEMKVAVLDEEGAYVRDAATDEIGTVVMRGPNVFPGYKDDFHNRAAWVDGGDGGRLWLNTGDLGRQDADGYFWLTGRKKELIIRGGHNIDPKLVEDPLCTHPAVAMAAAVGRPDPHSGEVPVAYVQLHPQARVRPEELQEFCRQHITERAAVPKSVIIVDELPLTPVGKIFKPALVREQIAQVFRQVLKDLAPGRFEVEVLADPRHGNLAVVKLADPAGKREAVEAALGAYAVRHEIRAL